MANKSIKSAFERLWYHIALKLNGYVKTETFDKHIADTSNPHNITLEDFGITATSEDINHVGGVTSNIQEQLNGKMSVTNPTGYGTLSMDGDAWFSGSVKVGGESQGDESAKEIATKEYVDNALSDFRESDASQQIEEHNMSETSHADIREAIDNLPIDVAEDGYTDIAGLRHMTNASHALNGNTLTITQTLEGGVEVVDTVQLDENGFPSSGMSNGVSWTMGWEGFEIAPTIPSCTESDNDKFLCVVDGVPAWKEVPSAEEATF
jgi:hypothetical protein